MNKSMKFLGIAVVALVAIMAVVMLLDKEDTLDFRGDVTNISKNGNNITYTIEMEDIETKYTVIADEKTKVSNCHGDDHHKHEMKAEDIKVGDRIEGNYRSSKEKIAKTIDVHQHEH